MLTTTTWQYDVMFSVVIFVFIPLLCWVFIFVFTLAQQHVLPGVVLGLLACKKPHRH